MRRPRTFLVLTCLLGATCALVACGFDGVGAGAPDAAAAEAEGAVDSGPPTSDATPEATVDGGPATSCKALLARDPSRLGQSGVYPIAPAGAATATVYCDFSIDQGGWTLVGRSAPKGKMPFGWRSAAGTVTDSSTAYSLDVIGARLVFGEVMLAERDMSSLGGVARAYKLQVAPDFVSLHGNDLTLTGTITWLLGDCSPTPSPTMLKWTGATAFTDDFFFRDIDDTGQHRGLRPDGWDLAYGDCNQGASLDAKQGLIFVR
ncbi:MAG: hypothetical protein JWO86_840 [Myxococcaceae bacterium]|nr:hypothetical protein [Myxococcaceae bacterium]